MSEITKLPDGSAFFTAEIMSRTEAEALPPNKRPLCYRISSEIYHAVFEAVGAASMCWKPRPGDQVFSSEEASQIAVDLCFKIADEIEELHEIRGRYNELIFAVARKFENETRHKTALRYILESETGSGPSNDAGQNERQT